MLYDEWAIDFFKYNFLKTIVVHITISFVQINSHKSLAFYFICVGTITY